MSKMNTAEIVKLQAQVEALKKADAKEAKTRKQLVNLLCKAETYCVTLAQAEYEVERACEHYDMDADEWLYLLTHDDNGRNVTKDKNYQDFLNDSVEQWSDKIDALEREEAKEHGKPTWPSEYRDEWQAAFSLLADKSMAGEVIKGNWYEAVWDQMITNRKAA